MADELGRPWHCRVVNDIWIITNSRGENVARSYTEDDAVAIVGAVNAGYWAGAACTKDSAEVGQRR